MKFNWGHGITLTLIAFIGFIAFLVRGTFMERVDLTSEDYYQREVDFEDERHELMAADQLGEVTLEDNGESIHLNLPGEDWSDVKVNFYRNDNAELDFELETTPENGTIVLDKPTSGMWSIEIVANRDSDVYRWKFSQYI